MGCRNCCNVFWGLVLLAGAIASVGAPWYFVVYQYDLPSGTGATEQCTMVDLYGWRDVYCRTSSNCPESLKDTCKQRRNWRDACTENCDDLKRAFDGGYGLAVIGLFCSLVTSVGFCTRACSADSRKSKLHIFFTLLGVAAFSLGMIVFATRVPHGFAQGANDEIGVVCNKALLTGGDTPCNKFFGDVKPTTSAAGFHRVAWGGAGWIAALITAVINILALCLACTQKRQTDPYEHVGAGSVAHGEAPTYTSGHSYQAAP